MNFLDKLFNRLPSKDKFARMIMDGIRQAGATENIIYDPVEFRLIVEGEGGTRHFLNNAYYEYCTVPKKVRPEILQRYIRHWFLTQAKPPEEYEDIKHDLLPIVRAHSYFELTRQRIILDGCKKTPNYAYHLLDDYYAVGLVYDLPESMRSISQDDLDRWGITFFEALEVAKENLMQLDHAFIGPPEGEGVYVSASNDSYESSRLLLLDIIRQFKVKGDHIAMAPNRNKLIVTGTDDLDGLKAMLALAKEPLQQPYAIGGIVMRLDGDDWTSWMPNSDHPLYQEIRLMQIQSYGQDYNEQKDLLDKLHEKNGNAIFVASYSAMENKEAGKLLSYSVWSKNVLTILPKTDIVAFFQKDAEPIMADWDRVVETVGNLMEPLEMYPPRWKVSEYPTDEQLVTMGKEIE